MRIGSHYHQRAPSDTLLESNKPLLGPLTTILFLNREFRSQRAEAYMQKAMKSCNYCNSSFNGFIPYRGGTAKQPRSIRLLEVVGSDIDNFSCPACGSTDRERHLKLFCESARFLKPAMRILHFAPERQFSNYLSSFAPELHIFADVNPKSRSFENIDIESIPYSDECFDLVIANHVLEHVKNVDLALAEINRVLKKEGLAILQTPFSKILNKTFDDVGINSAELRESFFGQDDHLRLFGLDISRRFSEHLKPHVQKHSDLLGAGLHHCFGVNEEEPFFLYGKRMAFEDSTSALLKNGDYKVIRSNPQADQKPLVSVICTTYNHEAFINKTVDQIVSQKAQFNFELLIGDDLSQDRTREIVANARGSSNCEVRIFLNDKNLGMHRNLNSLLEKSRGKYIAICEGDDYWTDLYKLQKQADFLESHPEYSLVYTSASAIDVGRNNQIDHGYIGGAKSDLSSLQLIASTPINTLTTMFKNLILPLPCEFFMSGAADLFLWSLLGWAGKGKYLNNVLPSIYRKHVGGVHSSKSEAGKVVLAIRTHYALFSYYSRINQVEVSDYFLRSCALNTKFIFESKEEAAIQALIDLPVAMSLVCDRPENFNAEPLQRILDRQR